MLRNNTIIYCLLIVAPQIIPFDFGDEAINAEDMTSLQCTVSKGDMPLKIQWLHNGVVIQPSEGVIISRTSKRISTLSIESVQATNSGEYTCSASNKAGTISHTAVLNVNGDFNQIILPLKNSEYIVESFSFHHH